LETLDSRGNHFIDDLLRGLDVVDESRDTSKEPGSLAHEFSTLLLHIMLERHDAFSCELRDFPLPIFLPSQSDRTNVNELEEY
jgi:hypothetical protein